MTINTNPLIQESILNRMVQLAFRGQNQNPDLLNSALGVLNKCGLNAEQNAKIAAILKNVPSDNASQATTEMKERILAVLSGKDIVLEVAPNEKVSFSPRPQIIPMDQICFSNVQTSVYIDHLLDDIIRTLFFQCQSTCEWESIGALACVNTHYYQCATAYWKQFDLKLFCPAGLTILDAKTQDITVDDEPLISKLAILNCFKNLAPHVENNEGLTLLTMAKGLTLNQLVEIAEKGGMNVQAWPALLLELGDIPVEQTYVILITNSVFMGSRNKHYDQHKECVAGHGCELPTIQEYVALYVFANKFFQMCPYGHIPWTWGRSSTHVGSNNVAVNVGCSYPTSIDINSGPGAHKCFGAGGQRKF